MDIALSFKIVALICWFVAVFISYTTQTTKLNLIALGLFFWFVVELF